MNRVVLITVTSTGFGRTAAATLARRGYPKYQTVQNFIAAGCKKEQVIELLLGIALKTVSNYLDHISPTPLDRAFAAESE
jgi:NAD(P)-dependent dehydrogenase (short-subunit alcohol dehydrogenase family)